MIKIKFEIKTQTVVDVLTVEQKVLAYLERNHYRVTEKKTGYVIFVEDEFSKRKVSKSDIHTRIGEGKFEYSKNLEGTALKLTYLTQIAYPIFLIMVFAAFGIVVNSVMPAICSTLFLIPVLFKWLFMREHVFDNILEC